MPTIEIDDEVLGFIEQHATGFSATPNSVLRHLLGIYPIEQSEQVEKKDNNQFIPRPPRSPWKGQRGPFHQKFGPSFPRQPRSRRRRASLDTLVKAGILNEGQKLILKDFQGNVVEGAEAVVREGRVWFGDRPSSMSKLAGELLRGCGYTSPAFRGPRHWFTEDGRSIDALWQAYQNRGTETEPAEDRGKEGE